MRLPELIFPSAGVSGAVQGEGVAGFGENEMLAFEMESHRVRVFAFKQDFSAVYAVGSAIAEGDEESPG